MIKHQKLIQNESEPITKSTVVKIESHIYTIHFQLKPKPALKPICDAENERNQGNDYPLNMTNLFLTDCNQIVLRTLKVNIMDLKKWNSIFQKRWRSQIRVEESNDSLIYMTF